MRVPQHVPEIIFLPSLPTFFIRSPSPSIWQNSFISLRFAVHTFVSSFPDPCFCSPLCKFDIFRFLFVYIYCTVMFFLFQVLHLLTLKGTVQWELRWVKIGINRSIMMSSLAFKCPLLCPKGHHHERSINILSGCNTF
jgi:hypothetical protein